METRPEIFKKLKAAKRIRPLQIEGDYSYSMSQITGDRFVMIGDAARFVDPIFSSGVSIALSSAKFAAADILEAAKAGDFGGSRFEGFATTMRRGCRNWYEFIQLYYRLNVLFTYFVNKPKYRIDLLRLLAGDVWDEEQPEVLDRMRNVVEKVEKDEKHIWHDMLGTLVADQFRPKF
jgi:FADH2 O2-dependent halogenase